MNKAYDYNGVVVSQSKPVQKLRTIKKTIHINSGDRDFTQYPTNGDFMTFLPKSYDNVVLIRVKGAEFPPLLNGTGGNYFCHDLNSTGSTFKQDYALGLTGLYSLYLDIDNLNKSDETGPCVVTLPINPVCTACAGLTYCGPKKSCLKKTSLSYGGSDRRSTYIENTFAKFQLPATQTEPLLYNESSSIHNESYYQPPLSRLDRLHLHLRTHSQKGGAIGATAGFIYTSGGTATTNLEYGISLEIEMVENAFDDYSTLETRLSERSGSGYWQS